MNAEMRYYFNSLMIEDGHYHIFDTETQKPIALIPTSTGCDAMACFIGKSIEQQLNLLDAMVKAEKKNA